MNLFYKRPFNHNLALLNLNFFFSLQKPQEQPTLARIQISNDLLKYM